MRVKPYGDHCSSGWVLRGVEHYRSSGRTVVGDSAFSSVITAVRLLSWNIGYVGIVKSQSRYFPLKVIRQLNESLSQRGDVAVFLTRINEVELAEKERGVASLRRRADEAFNGNDPLAPIERPNIMAVGWIHSRHRSPMVFISTAGSSEYGEDWVGTKRRRISDSVTEYYQASIRMPRVVKDYFDASDIVDQHNRLRQGELALEREWMPKEWSLRFFSSILGMCVVDAFLARRFLHPNLSRDPLRNFVKLLIASLLKYGDKSHSASRRLSGGGVQADDELVEVQASIPAAAFQSCSIYPLRQAPYYQEHKVERPRLSCVVCSRKADYYCVKCSHATGPHPRFFPLCGLQADRDVACLHKHLAGVGASGRTNN